MQGGRKVLLVDDDLDLRDTYRDILEINGFKVVTAANGPTALHLLQWETPDAVLLDYAMPGINGIEVLKHIRLQHPFLPVILLTAHTEKDIFFRAGKHGANDFVMKPPEIDDMIARIKSTIAMRQPVNADLNTYL